MKTLIDVFSGEDEVRARLDQNWYLGGDRKSSMAAPYDSVDMGHIALLPDAVALRLVEALFVHNTHFVPGSLPGNSMAIGDIVESEGAIYLTVHWGVMFHNMTMLHAARPFKDRCVEKAAAGPGGREAFAELDGDLRALRRRMQHKGRPRVHDGMFLLSSPAASGGASWDSVTCSDDVIDAVPHNSALFIVAAQSDRIGIQHIGAGHVIGKHFVFVLPKEPLLKIQELVDADAFLPGLWDKLRSVDDKREHVQAWHEATLPHKRAVVRAMAPAIIRDRVLGFHLDFTVPDRAAWLSPVAARAHYESCKDALGGKVVIDHVFADLLYEDARQYGKAASIFDDKEAA